jgi:tRNA dimethylallyltransferase
MSRPKVVVIVGPTASGKTSLSIELALKFRGEIISADSRQVYRGLDLGSGKVTSEEMRGTPHHMLDVADPDTVYTVSDYVREGRAVLEGILGRNNLPIIVGGSFFYVDALIGKVTLPEVEPNPALRSTLEEKSTTELYTLLQTADPERAVSVDKDNRRRLIRALEINAELGAVPLPTADPLFDTYTLGIEIPKETLHQNIHMRLIERLRNGMVEEVKQLHDGGLSFDRLDALGLEYRYISHYLEGKLGYEEMVTTLETKIRQFAKRQMTWLKRDPNIVWVDKNATEEILEGMKNFLNR